MVELSGVTRRFGGVEALSAVSLTLERGRAYALLGPNGAGKTTLMRVLLGMEPVDAGSVALFGRSPDDAGRSKVGYVPDDPPLFDFHRAGAMARLACRLRGVPIERADRWLERLGLAERHRTRIRALSRGERQRLSLALALLAEPELLVLDEPMSNLDLDWQLRVWALVREQVERGATVLVGTHRMLEADSEVSDVLFLQRGRLIASGARDAICEPGETLEHAYVRLCG